MKTSTVLLALLVAQSALAAGPSIDSLPTWLQLRYSELRDRCSGPCGVEEISYKAENPATADQVRVFLQKDEPMQRALAALASTTGLSTALDDLSHSLDECHPKINKPQQVSIALIGTLPDPYYSPGGDYQVIVDFPEVILWDRNRVTSNFLGAFASEVKSDGLAATLLSRIESVARANRFYCGN